MHFLKYITVDLHNGGPADVPLGTLFRQDQAANRLCVHVLDGGQAAALTGYTAKAYVMRADGVTLTLTGAVSGSDVYVDLGASAYEASGPIAVSLKALDTTNGVKLGLARFWGSVSDIATDEIIDPSQQLSIRTIDAAYMAAVLDDLEDAIGDAESMAGAFTNNHGIQVGTDSEATASNTAALGWATAASGASSQAMGSHTIANHAGQHVFGAWNVADPSEANSIYPGNYIEIVGNGNSSARSNARTLDWQGNEEIAGEMTAAGVNLSRSMATLYGVKTAATHTGGRMTWIDIDVAAGETVYVDVGVVTDDTDKSYMIALSPDGSTLLTGITVGEPGVTAIVAPQDCVKVAVYKLGTESYEISVKAFTGATMAAYRRINEALPDQVTRIQHGTGTMATVPFEVLPGDIVYILVTDIVGTGYQNHQAAFGDSTSDMHQATMAYGPGVTRMVSGGHYSNVYVYFNATSMTGAKITILREGAAASFGTYSILGDSYSAYAGYIPSGNNNSYPISGNDVDDVTQMWWRKFGDAIGATLGMDESWSGSSVCNYAYSQDQSDHSFIARMKNLPESDLIFVFGGSNDAWGGSALGSYQYSGWTETDLNSFRPAYAYMLNWLRTNRPGSVIVAIVNDLGSTYADYVTSMQTIAAHYGVPAVTLSDIEKISGHPDKAGMAEIGGQVLDALLPRREYGQTEGGIRALGEQVNGLDGRTAALEGSAVSYGGAQTLTDAQKKQARTNIGAPAMSYSNGVLTITI